MKKKSLMLVVGLVLVVALNACSTVSVAPGKVVYSENLSSNIEDMDVIAHILVTEDTTLLYYNAKGEPLAACRLPEPKDKAKTKQLITDSTLPVCKGLEAGFSVISIQALPIIKSNSDPCIMVGPDASGGYHEVCW